MANSINPNMKLEGMGKQEVFHIEAPEWGLGGLQTEGQEVPVASYNLYEAIL